MKCRCKYEIKYPEFESAKERKQWVESLPSEILEYLLGNISYNIIQLKDLAERYPEYFEVNE